MYTWTTVPVFEVFIFFGFLCGGTQYLKTPSESPKVSLLLYNLYVHVCTMCTCGGRVPPVRPHVHTSYMTSHTAHEDRLASIFQFSNLKGICWQDSDVTSTVLHLLSMKYLTGMRQSLAVTTSLVKYHVAPWGASGPEHVD